MWKRKDLKKEAKKKVKKNYAAAVVICFILAFIGIEFTESVELIHKTSDDVDNYTIIKDMTNKDGNEQIQEESTQISEEDITLEQITSDFVQTITAKSSWLIKIGAGGLFWLGSIISLLFMFFVSYPILVGARRFFVKNQDDKPRVTEIFSVFKGKEYLNITYVMFCRYVFNFLWTLLFIVPGIIKSYEYRLIPYVVAENPNVKRKRAFELSREMMKGQKFKTFVLDLSFLLWDILASFTFGLLGIFYVNPYKSATFAELYTTLKLRVIDDGFIKDDELSKTPFINEEV